MRIKLLTGNGEVRDMVAVKVKGKKGDYYNIHHGSKDPGFHNYVINMEAKEFIANNTSKDSLPLNADTYILKPVYEKSILCKDRIGNTKYCLSVDNNMSHIKDIIIFLEIPNFNYTDVKFRIVSGDCSYLGMGINGKNRDGVLYKSPAPIIETSGNFTIEWVAKDISDNIVGSIISYDNESSEFKTEHLDNSYEFTNKKFIEIKDK